MEVSNSIIFDDIVDVFIGNRNNNDIHYETFRLKTKVDDNELVLESHPVNNKNTIDIKLVSTMKLSPTLVQFNKFCNAEADCKDEIQKIPDIVISNNSNNDNIVIIKIPFKYNDIQNDVPIIVDKSREEVLSTFKNCYSYLRERLAQIILMDALNNPEKDNLKKAIDDVSGNCKLLSKGDPLLKRVQIVYDNLVLIEQWNETHTWKNSKDDEDLETSLNLYKDPILTDQDIKTLESHGSVQWKERNSSKFSPSKISISSKITHQDVIKAAAAHHKQLESFNIKKIGHMILVIIVSCTIILFKNSGNGVSNNETGIGQNIKNTVDSIGHVSKLSKTFVMNSISNTKNNARAMKMNFNNKMDSEIMVQVTDSIYHIKSVFKNPFSFLFGMKKVIDKLVDALSQNFEKLFNFNKNKA